MCPLNAISSCYTDTLSKRSGPIRKHVSPFVLVQCGQMRETGGGIDFAG